MHSTTKRFTTKHSTMFLRTLAAVILTAACGEGPTDPPVDSESDPASILLTSATVQFTVEEGASDPSPESIAISNGGDDALDGLSVSIDYGSGAAGWLSASLDRADAPANLSVAPIVGGMGPGSYEAQLQVSSTRAGVSPKSVSVSLTVNAAPPRADSLWLSISSVELESSEGGANPDFRSVEVGSTSGDPLPGLAADIEYESGQPTGWLNTRFDAPSTPTIMWLQSNTGALSAGTYRATVTVSAADASNPPQTIEVTLDVTPPGPSITLSRSSVDFIGTVGSSNPATQNVTIRNGGTGTLDGLEISVTYPAGEETGWLRPSLSSTTAPTAMNVTASTSSLREGTHRATIEVTSPASANGSRSVDVTLEMVASGPSVAVSTDHVVIGASEGGPAPASQVVDISNSETGELTGLAVEVSYGFGQAEGWLAVSLDRTAAPARLTLTATPGTLPERQYDATVSVTSPVASNSPVEVAVSLRIVAGVPDLTFAAPLTASSPVVAGAWTDVSEQRFVNEGTGRATTILNGWYLSTDPVITAEDQLVGSNSLSNLRPGEEFVWGAGSISIPPDTPPGDYYVGILTDHHNAIAESDETNNYISAPITVTAPAPNGYTLSVDSNPGAGGSVQYPTQPSFPAGTVVSLIATPAMGYQFLSWAGDASGDQNPVTIIMDQDRAITANFGIVQPELSGSYVSDAVELTWTFEWPCDFPLGPGCLASSVDHYEVEQSTTSPTSGFSVVYTSPIGRASPATASLPRGPGTYYYRVRTFGSAWTSPYSEVITVSAEASGPAAPSELTTSVSGAVVTLSWRDNSTNETGFRIHASEDNRFTSIDVFEVGANVRTLELTDNTPPSRLFFRAFAFNASGTSAASNVASATTASRTVARFVNNSGYSIVSLQVDGTEYFPSSPQAILPGTSGELEVAPGRHTYYMENGFWDGRSRFSMYSLAGSFSMTEGQTQDIVFEDPSIEQVLTNFSSSRAWDGQFFTGTTPHVATFIFHANGSWQLLVDGSQTQTGSYQLVQRNPGGFNIEFTVGGFTGTLWETFGYFTMRNGPPEWPLIEYYPR